MEYLLVARRIARRFVPTRRQVIVACSRLVLAGLLIAGAKYAPGRAAEWIATLGHVAIILAVYGLVMHAESVFQDHVVAAINRLEERWIVWRHYNPRGSAWDELQIADALETHRQRRKAANED
jgi:hypothetical protein